MEIKRKLIDRIYNQKFSFGDQEEFLAYLENSDTNGEVRNHLEQQWNQFNQESEDQPDLDHIFYKLYYESNKNRDSKKRRLFVSVARVAAVLVAGLIIAGSIYFSFGPRHLVSEQPVEFISHTGFRNQFKLSDGTTGWLGYGSQLKFHFDRDHKRIVDLDGLAYFDVAHRADEPFVVNTPAKLNIEVLGTRFNVSAYSGDQSCEVVLEQGKVKLSVDDQKKLEMQPNERVMYHVSGNTLEKADVNVADYTAWKDGKLILQDVTLAEICRKFSQFYNVDFEIMSRTENTQKVRLVLENESLDDALKLLTMILPVTFQETDRKMQNNDSYSRKKIIIKNK